MSNQKAIGIALIGVGALVLIVSLAADMFGLGEAGGFGFKQILGTAGGVVLVIVGFVLFSREKAS